MAKNYVKYINGNLRKLADYINHIVDLNNKYGKAVKDLCNQSKKGKVTKSKELIEYEKEMKQSYDKAIKLYNDLTQIAERYKAGRNIDSDIKWFHSNFNLAGLTTYKKITLKLEPSKQDGIVTGGAAISINPRKADFSDMAQKHWSMRTNINLNNNNPDAQELANIFLASPKNAPESEEYKYIPPSSSCILNSRYNLKGNKKIDNFWSGFAYSKYSTLAKNVSNYSYLKNQLVEHYNSSTGKFDKDKIEVNFDNDLNLHRALGHATILEPTIDRNGYFHGILFDKYDFDLKYKDMYNDIFTTAANDYFWILQETHRNKNFYILAPVTFKW